jgi:hypothetical protein
MTTGTFLVALERGSDIGQSLDDVWEEVLRREKTLEKLLIIPACPEYDHDPREVWQIPEGVALFRRAIDAGLYGLLTLPGMLNKQLEVPIEMNPLIWVFPISRGVGKFTPDMDAEFKKEFDKSCVVWNQRHPDPVKRCGTCKCLQFGPRGTGRVCAKCGSRSQALMCCARCHAVSYCDRACQRAHWDEHKTECQRC